MIITIEELQKEIIEMGKLVKRISEESRKQQEEIQKIKDKLFNSPEYKIIEEKTKQEFESLLNLLNSKHWPVAVDPNLILDINSEIEKKERSEAILEIKINENLTNKKFLDFGCNEGYCVTEALKTAKLAVGYDIENFEQWNKFEKKDNLLFTTEWEKVKEKGPYDYILIYDVLDHCEQPIEELKRIKEVCNKNTQIYITFHPFCSRHATHLYREINKIFIHLIFSEVELELLGYKQEKIQKVLYPQKTYKKWLDETGFKIIHMDVIKEEVPDFIINTALISNRIKKLYADADDPLLRNNTHMPTAQLSQVWLDTKVTII